MFNEKPNSVARNCLIPAKFAYYNLWFIVTGSYWYAQTQSSNLSFKINDIKTIIVIVGILIKPNML